MLVQNIAKRWILLYEGYIQEYVQMRGKMNSTGYEILFWLKISLQCSLSSLLVFT